MKKEEALQEVFNRIETLFKENNDLYIGDLNRDKKISYYDYDSEWEIYKSSYLIKEKEIFKRTIEANPYIKKAYSVDEAWEYMRKELLANNLSSFFYDYVAKENNINEEDINNFFKYYKIH